MLPKKFFILGGETLVVHGRLACAAQAIRLCHQEKLKEKYSIGRNSLLRGLGGRLGGRAEILLKGEKVKSKQQQRTLFFLILFPSSPFRLLPPKIPGPPPNFLNAPL